MEDDLFIKDMLKKAMEKPIVGHKYIKGVNFNDTKNWDSKKYKNLVTLEVQFYENDNL